MPVPQKTPTKGKEMKKEKRNRLNREKKAMQGQPSPPQNTSSANAPPPLTSLLKHLLPQAGINAGALEAD